MQTQLLEHVEAWRYAIQNGTRGYTAYVTRDLMTGEYRWGVPVDDHSKPTYYQDSERTYTSHEEMWAEIGNYIRGLNREAQLRESCKRRSERQFSFGPQRPSSERPAGAARGAESVSQR